MALATQRDESERASALERFEHSEALSKMTEMYSEELQAKEKLQQALARSEAEHKASQLRLQGEVDSLRHYGARANFNLDANTRALVVQREEAQREADETLTAEREVWERQRIALEAELARVRRVQVDVLEQGGALPGSEARQYLFFEATKFGPTRPGSRRAGGTATATGSKGGGGSKGAAEGPGGKSQSVAAAAKVERSSGVLQAKPSISWRGQQEEPPPESPPWRHVASRPPFTRGY